MEEAPSKNDIVEIPNISEDNDAEKALPHPHNHIVLIPHPSDDPRDPLVCVMLVYLTLLTTDPLQIR